MNWKDAQKRAKEIHRGCEPSRPAGFSVDGGVVYSQCHDNNTCVVLHNETDLRRMRMSCDVALRYLAESKGDPAC